MSDPFIGEIRMVGFNYAPMGWAFCAGQTVSINQNQALFALLGVTFGGNGQTNFLLPDLQGRSPVGMGSGAGLSPIILGAKNGTENAQLTISNMPIHNHTATQAGYNASLSGTTTIVATTSTSGGTAPAAGSIFGPAVEGGRPANSYYPATTNPQVNLANGTTNVSGQVTPPAPQIGNSGSSLPFSLRNPYLGINFIISMQGIFPPHS